MRIKILTYARVPGAVGQCRHQTLTVVLYVAQAAQSVTGMQSDCTVPVLFLTQQSNVNYASLLNS